MEIITPDEFKALMDAFTTRIKGGDYHECDQMTVNMYYQSVGVRIDSTELIEKFNHLYREWNHYRLPSPEEWLKAGEIAHKTNASAYSLALPPIKATPLLQAPNLSEVEKANQKKQNRITILAAIYQGQGESNFYKAMLRGRSQSWGGVIEKLTGHSGEITHDEVMDRVAQNAQSQKARKIA